MLICYGTYFTFDRAASLWIIVYIFVREKRQAAIKALTPIAQEHVL